MMSAARDMVLQGFDGAFNYRQMDEQPQGLALAFSFRQSSGFVVWWICAAIMGSWFPRTEDGKIVFGQIFLATIQLTRYSC